MRGLLVHSAVAAQFTQLSVGNDQDGRMQEFGKGLSVRGQVFECR